MKKILISAALCLSGVSAFAVNPLWVRDARISPDGNTIAFVYKGDIFTVPSVGGQARRLTSSDALNSAPVWSPDGKSIAFASDRNGGLDVYIMSADGGTPRRLTYNSVAETPEAFTPDGSNVLFSAVIQDPAASALAPMRPLCELYSVPVEGGRISQVLGTPAVNLAMSPEGGFFYEDIKGMEDKWRKHHTSSVTRDIWLYDPAAGTHNNITDHAGEDRSPAISPDGSTLYFLSERNGGSLNVYELPVNAPKGTAPKAVTDFSDHPVRFLSMGANGLMAFTYNGQLYTMRPGGKAAPLAIQVIDTDIEEPERINFSRVSEAVPSPDGNQVAFITRGEVVVTSTEHNSTRRVTDTPAVEQGLTWGADGRSLYYGSLRSGRSNIYKASIGRADDPNFSNATAIKEEALFPDDGVERGYPSVSPDGKKMAFVQDRTKLMVMDLDSKAVRALDGHHITNYRSGGFSVNWAPDSRWLTLEVTNPSRDPYSDIAIVDSETGEFVPITVTGYFDQIPRFTPDGNAVIFASERYGMRNHASWGSQLDVMMAFLNKEAYDRFRLSPEDFELQKEVEEQQKKAAKKDDDKDTKKSKKGKKEKGKKDNEAASADSGKKGLLVERDGIEDRIVRLTPASAEISDFVVSEDGETLYYLAAFEEGYDMWKKDLRKGDVSMVKKLDAAPTGIATDKDGNMFLVNSQVKRFNPKSGELKPVSTAGSLILDRAKEREAMLDYVANEARERFYLPEMPVDWDAYVENYRRFLPHINNNQAFAELLSELLGELNVSHSGGRYFGPSADVATASLGLLFDMTHNGEGLLVDEILAGGPFDRATTRVRPGVIVTAIDGTEIGADTDWTQALNGIGRRKTLVALRNPASGETWEEVVLPVSAAAVNEMLYDRWVKSREQAVDSLSGGRLGYVHIRSMSDDSFRNVYAKVLGKYADRDGIVIDTRWNGGGRLHEDIEVLFSGEKYLTQEIHGNKSSEMPSRRWNKPSVMIICEANYSNAHGTPWVYKKKNLGKLVGMPVPGTMSSVNWIDLQDPSLLFGVPVVAFRTAEGNVLENTQLEPDIKVANNPADVVRGIDAQLETAVRSLLHDIDAK
ncbi:MAG: peptidase S41 [Bacteroides sp.]|nr:peptidase S41 [Bacteroides sp.]